MEYGQDGTESIWNLDDAEFSVLFQIKLKFVSSLLKWDLEGAYWAVRTLRMELDAKLRRGETSRYLAKIEEEKRKLGKKIARTEKKQVDEGMKFLDEERMIFLNKPVPSFEDKSRFYIVLEDFYMSLCFIMKKHRMYFREGEDNRLAVLRR